VRGFALLLLLSVLVAPAGATDAVTLGYSDDGTVIGAGPDACGEGELLYHHDGSFEGGVAWQYAGVTQPYYGAFGEGFALGDPGELECAYLWVTTVPDAFHFQSCDIFVWSGGVTGAPGEVLYLLPGLVLTSVPDWPSFGENQIDMNCTVSGDITIGYWGNWPGELAGYYVAADLDGPGGHPWTDIAPNSVYPTGWQDPAVVWGYIPSLGLGLSWTPAGSPVESGSWGSIKRLFE